MKKIAVFTGTRAEYGLLSWVMQALKKDPTFELQVIVGGAHLSPQFGDTWQELEKDGLQIDAKIEMLLATDTPTGVIKSMGLALIGLSDALARLQPDALFLLGDRYEALAAAQAALILKIPIIHAHGGELTQGAYDDAVRHAISKMASLHFVANHVYQRRLIQMGEESQCVFNVGAFGLESIEKLPTLSLETINDRLGIKLKKPYFVITYHPVTLGNEAPKETFQTLLQALDDFPEYQLLFTYPNADNGGYCIIQMIEEYIKLNPKRAFGVRSMGMLLYINSLKQAEAVIGNSSSGIIEAPTCGIPTLNIGCRQEGRLMADSIITVNPGYQELIKGLAKVTDPEFKIFSKAVKNPYGNGEVSSRVLKVLQTHSLSPIKKFQDWSNS